MSKAKIIVVGPSESGKTYLSNFLADATEFSGGEYHPTQGVRILEFETSPRGCKNVDVEMWDCSGDRKFESCWPAMARDASGAVFVYNPDQPNHDKELDSWLKCIQQFSNLKPRHCICIAVKRLSSSGSVKCKLSNQFSKIPVFHTDMEESPEDVRDEFTRFLGTLVRAMSSTREQEELNIMNQ